MKLKTTGQRALSPAERAAAVHRIHNVQPPVFGQYAALGAIALCNLGAGESRTTVCIRRDVPVLYRRRLPAAYRAA